TDPLADLQKLLPPTRFHRWPALPAFTGGLVGYAGYDTLRYYEGEQLTAPPRDDRKLPDLLSGRYGELVAFHHVDRPRRRAASAAGKEYIRAGDIFQFVPSQRLRVHSDADPLDVYRALRIINPSPFMFYLKSPGCTLIGSSPEILVRVENGKATTRPLAGTR